MIIINISLLQQQMQAQHLPHAHAPPIPMGPHPAGLQPPGLPVSSAAGMGLLALGPGYAQQHVKSQEDKGLYYLLPDKSDQWRLVLLLSICLTLHMDSRLYELGCLTTLTKHYY